MPLTPLRFSYLKAFSVLPLVGVLSWAMLSASTGHTASNAQNPSVTPFTTSEVGLENTMNFSDCLNFEIQPAGCWDMCPSWFFGLPLPAPGIKFTYQEPTALVETSCIKGKSAIGDDAGAISQILVGSTLEPEEDQKCVEGISLPQGKVTRYYNEAHVWGISPLARYAASGDPLEATMSLSCGIFGAVGQLMDMSNLIGSIQNFSLQGLQDQISNLPQTIGDNITSSLQDLANLPAALQGSLASIGDQVGALAGNLQGSLGEIQNLLGSVTSGAMLQDLTDAIGNYGNQLASVGQALGQLPNAASGLGGQVSAIATQFSNLGSLDVTSLSSADLSTLITDLQKIDIGQLTGLTSQVGSALAPLSDITGFGNLANTLQATGGIDSSVWQSALTNLQTTLSASVPPVVQAPLSPNTLRTLMTAHTPTAYATQTYAQTAQFGGGSVNTSNIPVEKFIPKTVQAPMGNVPITGRGLRPTGKFLQSGNAQVGVEMLDREFHLQKSNISGLAKMIKKLSKDALTLNSKSETCSLSKTIARAEIKLETLKQQTSSPDYNLKTFPAWTYLPQGHIQKYVNVSQGRSCPISYAGYTVSPNLTEAEGVDKTPQNCNYICDDDGKKCRWVPRSGFYGSCLGNRLSQIKVDGKYPACNGMVPPKLLNPQAQNGPYVYSEAHDQRKHLNASRNETFKRTIEQAGRTINKAKQQLQRYQRQKNYNCDASPTRRGERTQTVPIATAMAKFTLEPAPNTNTYPTTASTQPVAGMLKALSRPPALHTTASQSMPQRLAQLNIDTAGANQMGNFQLGVAGLQQMVSGLDGAQALMQQGGLQQAANNMLGSKIPFGLWPAFISELTDWSTPPSDIISTIQFSLTSMLENSIAEFTCMPTQYAADYGISIPALTQLNKAANCVGIWGKKDPPTGWTYHKVKNVSAALVAYRAYEEAVKLGSIQPNTEGTQQFNADYPFIKSGSKHKGSGCYDVGTSKSNFYTAGEKDALDPTQIVANIANTPTTEMDNGLHVFTLWKKTSCCVLPCGKVKRYY